MSRSLYNPARDRLETFESPESYLAWINSLPANMRTHDRDNRQFRPHWYNNANGDDALRYLELGNTKYLAQAELLMDKMRDDGLLSEGQKIWQSDVVGAFPNVSNYLMGQPDTMFNRVETELQSNTTPIRIFVENGCSAGIPVDYMVARGIAVMGLALALKAMRPIELYCFSIWDVRRQNAAHGTCVRIETAPLDFDRATFMICDPGFYRQLQYASACHVSGQINTRSSLPWAWSQHQINDTYLDSRRAMLGAEPHDLIIPGVFLTNEKYITDPIGWIRQYIEQIKAAQ